MKKKLISLLCAVAMLMALPTMAWAAQFSSPGGTSATHNGTTLYVKGDDGMKSNGGYIVVEGADDHADNAQIGEGDYAASFKIYKVGEVDFTSLDLTFNTPSAYAGANAIIYADYGNGNYKTHEVTLTADGVTSITVTEIPSTFTLVVDAENLPSTGGSSDIDTGATSPQTGVDFTGIAVAGGVMAVAACGVAVALRKKVVE